MCELAANDKDRAWGGVGWQHACAMQTNMVPLNFLSIVAPMATLYTGWPKNITEKPRAGSRNVTLNLSDF